MGSLKSIMLAGAAAFVMIPGAFAADLGPLAPPLPRVQAPVEDFASGWYLRGDIGYSNQEVDALDNALYDAYGPPFGERLPPAQAALLTEPRMTRFMLPLPDALSLVDFALEHGRQGDVFIRKASAATIGLRAHAGASQFETKLPR